jgi:hypothetical protein
MVGQHSKVSDRSKLDHIGLKSVSKWIVSGIDQFAWLMRLLLRLLRLLRLWRLIRLTWHKWHWPLCL